MFRGPRWGAASCLGPALRSAGGGLISWTTSTGITVWQPVPAAPVWERGDFSVRLLDVVT